MRRFTNQAATKEARFAIGEVCRLAGLDRLPVISLTQLVCSKPKVLRLVTWKAKSRAEQGSETIIQLRMDQMVQVACAFRDSWPCGPLHWDLGAAHDEPVHLTLGPTCDR